MHSIQWMSKWDGRERGRGKSETARENDLFTIRVDCNYCMESSGGLRWRRRPLFSIAAYAALRLGVVLINIKVESTTCDNFELSSTRLCFTSTSITQCLSQSSSLLHSLQANIDEWRNHHLLCLHSMLLPSKWDISSDIRLICCSPTCGTADARVHHSWCLLLLLVRARDGVERRSHNTRARHFIFENEIKMMNTFHINIGHFERVWRNVRAWVLTIHSRINGKRHMVSSFIAHLAAATAAAAAIQAISIFELPHVFRCFARK